MAQQHLGVADLEIVLGLLHFVLVIDVAVGHVLVPLQVIDGFHALQVHGQTFQTDSQSTVRRHTMFEGIQILFHAFLRHTSVFNFLYQHIVIMDTLSACCDLKAFE